MFEEVLRSLGLSPNEAKIYETLLSVQSATISVVAVTSKVHRRNVYDSMSKLVDKGLVSQLVLENEKHYKAINPKRLLGLLKDKEMRLTSQLPEMQRRFQKVESKEQAYVYKGIQGFRNYMQDILDSGEDVYAFGAKGGWWDPRLTPLRIRFYKEMKKKKVNMYHLFDHDAEKKMPHVFKEHKLQAKFLPKKYSTNSAIDIFGDHVVTFSGLEWSKLDDDLTQFVVVSRKLADSYRTWFKMVWDFLPGPNF